MVVKHLARVGLTLGLACVAGCGDAIVRTQVSGAVIYDGQAVPVGRIYFNPDASKQNDGPQGYADIKDGRYDTRLSGKAPVPGALLVRVEGFDGQPEEGRPIGQALFIYETALDLAKGADATRDFKITTADAPQAGETDHAQ